MNKAQEKVLDSVQTVKESRQNLPTSNYFTFVVYVDEFDRFDEILKLGIFYASPVHYSSNNNSYITDKVGFVTGSAFVGKPHKHILVKTPNKMTQNSFNKLWCDVFKDNTGCAIHFNDSLVKCPSLMVRYFYHLDNPTKEVLPITNNTFEVSSAWFDVVYGAFCNEFSTILYHIIDEYDVCSVRHLINHCPEFVQYYLRKDHNLYYIKTILDEVKRGVK